MHDDFLFGMIKEGESGINDNPLIIFKNNLKTLITKFTL
jgi:hypothetical protein